MTEAAYALMTAATKLEMEAKQADWSWTAASRAKDRHTIEHLLDAMRAVAADLRKAAAAEIEAEVARRGEPGQEAAE